MLALAGSLRRGSLNRTLLLTAAQLAPPGLRITVDEVFPALPLFDEDLERATGEGPEEVVALRRRVAAADGLLIATPEYNQSIPGVLKNAIDWLSRPDDESVLAGKPVAVLGATPGAWGTRLAQSALRQVLTATESRLLPQPAFYLGHAARHLAEGADEPTRTRLRALLVAFADWIALTAPGRAEASEDAEGGFRARA